MQPIDNGIVKQFQEDGVTVLRQVISPDWIETLRAGLDKNIAEPGKYRREYSPEGASGHFFGDYCNWSRIAEYEDFARNSPAADLAAALMGSKKVNLFHEHVVVKEPGTAERTPWHHDQPYYCVDGNDTVSLWIPLDPVAQENGVEFIRGSHRWGKWYTPTKFTGVDYERGDDGSETIPDIEAHRDSYDIVSFELEPGDCVAFNFKTVHGAAGNSSAGTRRRAISFRWTGDDARFAIRPGEMSPPFPEFDLCTHKPGDVLDSALFPVVRAQMKRDRSEPLKDPSHLYEVERCEMHCERPGFHISEMQLGPTQTIPWHAHTEIADTFYILQGEMRLFLQEPKESKDLKPGETFTVVAGRPHLVTNAGDSSMTFLVLQGIGEYDYVPLV